MWRLKAGERASCNIEITEGAYHGLLPFPPAGSSSAVVTFEFGAGGSQLRPPATCGMSAAALLLPPPGVGNYYQYAVVQRGAWRPVAARPVGRWCL